jgi:hypothetical protein
MATEIPSTEDIPNFKSADYRDYYANSCQVRLGPWDVTIVFGHTKEMNGTIATEEKSSVTLSPQQFKAFAEVCANTVSAYEQAFGELKLPRSFLDREIPPVDQYVEAYGPTEAKASSNEKVPPSKRSRGAAREKA